MLTVALAGTGSGTVTSAPGGINCSGDCTESYTSGEVVALTATPDGSSVFAGWSGDPDCADGNVTVDVAKSCTATFNSGGVTAEPCPCVGFGVGWGNPFASGNWDVFLGGLFGPATTCTNTGTRVVLTDPTGDFGVGSATAAADSTLLQCEISGDFSGSTTWGGVSAGEGLGCYQELLVAYESVFGAGSCP